MFDVGFTARTRIDRYCKFLYIKKRKTNQFGFSKVY